MTGLTLGFFFGVFFGILATFFAIGVGCVLKDRRLEMERREWHAGMDGLLRDVSMAKRKRRNNERVLGAVREVLRTRERDRSEGANHLVRVHRDAELIGLRGNV